ncbi:hypothetical protein ADUPG1_001462, partial [Aduncisulcus paluster]
QFGTEAEEGISPELEKLSVSENIEPELLQRARDREEEERDLRVLDAYNRFESGLQEILANPESGLMELRAGDAQSAVFEVNDYFTEEGGVCATDCPMMKAVPGLWIFWNHGAGQQLMLLPVIRVRNIRTGRRLQPQQP